MPSASKTAAKKAPAKPAAKPAAPSKAAQAAAAQGRTAPASKPAPEPERAQPQRAAAVPATRPSAPPPSTETMNSLPAFMRNDIDAGKDNLDADDLQIPRLKLIQGVSPELEEFNELRAGNYFHPAAEWIFDEPFRAVVLFMDKRYILWRPRDDGGGILARADDGVHWSPGQGEFEVKLDKKDGGATVKWKLAKTVQQSGLANWGTMNPNDPDSPPAATLMYNYLLAFPDHPDLMPAVMTFQRSAVKIGRQFNTKIKTVRTPIYGSIYEFSAKKEGDGQNSYYVPQVKGAGLIEDEALYHQYKSLAQSYGQSGLNIKDIEGLQGDANEFVEGDDAQDGDGPQM
jgi:hypothetical protein